MTQVDKGIIDKYVQERDARFQLNYLDHDSDTWTAPVLLTAPRAITIKNDMSIRTIKILWRAMVIIINP